MSVSLRSLNLIVPIALIEARYPGGLEACVEDHESLIGDRVWFDRHLWRDGADTRAGVRALVDGWSRVGLMPVARHGDGWRWHELCVVSTSRGAATLPCEWLALDVDSHLAWWSDDTPGVARGPERFVRAPVDVRVHAPAPHAGWRGFLDRLTASPA